jgi:hypothetical protein
VVAAHATCYELRTKVDALKVTRLEWPDLTCSQAVAAFWNPYYYDPHRPTLTMGLFYLSNRQVGASLFPLPPPSENDSPSSCSC